MVLAVASIVSGGMVVGSFVIKKAFNIFQTGMETTLNKSIKAVVKEEIKDLSKEQKLQGRRLECLKTGICTVNGQFKDLAKGVEAGYERRWSELEREEDILNNKN